MSRMWPIVRASIKPGNFQVMARKVLHRITSKEGGLSRAENLDWLKAEASDFNNLAERLNPTLWAESLAYAESLKSHAAKILAPIPYNLTGSGFYTLLYFLVRWKKPSAILETGVAAGWSSHAFLTAIEINGVGHLYSSDFPYFRIPDAEQLVGILVEPQMKRYWSLEIRGDEHNLPKLLARIERVDFFHYDSDKTYEGRRLAFDLVRPKLAEDALIVMDDLQDNAFFFDIVADMPRECWHVFPRGKSFVGVLGSIDSS